jgi:hypothetical protein
MQFALSHRHPARECGIAYAAWRGFDSPLRHAPTLASCGSEPAEAPSEHLLLWTVDATSEEAALALLPRWLAERTEVRRVAEVPIP